MFEELFNNVETEINLVRELNGFLSKVKHEIGADAQMIEGIINSIRNKIRILNNSLPELILHISLSESFRDINEKNVKKVEFGDGNVSVKQDDLKKFVNELKISKELIKKLKKGDFSKKKNSRVRRKIGFYSKLSNKFFLGTSQRWLSQRKFESLVRDLRRSNSNILGASYISMMLSSVFLSLFFAFFLTIFLSFIEINPGSQFISFYDSGQFVRFIKISWIIVVIPALTWVLFYAYPSAEKKSMGRKIDQELPFVVIQMGSISGSGIEPLEIFKIIGTNKDYKYANKEIIKLLNEINIYGHDLVSALSNISMSTPSSKLSELFSGLATTISSGGDMKTFFEKRAESLLLDYGLEREKFTKVAETFMDIYISVVIATPMILLLLLVMISVSGVSIGLGINQMSILIMLVVGFVNVIFLVFLHLKQPSY